MKTLLALAAAALAVGFRATAAAESAPAPSNRAMAAPAMARTLPFDRDWRFHRGDLPGAEAPAFADADWETVDLPHDWAIAGPFDRNNATGPAGGFLPAGMGWYRKTFPSANRFTGRKVFVDFDGVMANSDVWINGHHLGNRPYGYSSFRYELTDWLRPAGGTNVLAVRVDDSKQPASRWYAGAGIYRHVRLVVTDPVHFQHWGTVVTTPSVTPDEAVIAVRSSVVNSAAQAETMRVDYLVSGPNALVAKGQTPFQTIAPGRTARFEAHLAIAAPERWDVNHPALYRLIAQVFTRGSQGADGARMADTQEVPFGIRSFRFDPATGFWLNGRNLKLQGVCIHSEGSAFGAAVPLDVWRWRLAALRALGVNAIRTAHNPPAPEFLDLCDRMGFLVMDESFDCWEVGKNPYDYHLYFDHWSKIDARDQVRRDRNHPSIVLWSSGNEIHDTPRAARANEILAGLIAVFHRYDPTRPVTQALLRPNRSHDYTDGLAAKLDVVGTNYRYAELLAAHDANPSWKIVGTENGHDVASWLAVRDHPAYSGEFIWSGIDYLGEAWFWPHVASGSGLIDRTGFPHPDGEIVRSWWSSQPMVFVARRVAATPPRPVDPGYGPAMLHRRFQVLFPDWTPRQTGPHDEQVEVYSNCDEVELVLNGRSLGTQRRAADLSPRHWTVPYEAGTLRALGRDQGRLVAESDLRTAGAPARIRLEADKEQLAPGWDRVARLTAWIVDANGTVVPNANVEVSFSVQGPGTVAATDSADNSSHESFQAPQRRAFQGRCEALIRATGRRGVITVKATAPGLVNAAVALAAIP